jgi:pseudouridylate synthase I
MILLRLGYIGTAYHGFQVQTNAVTIQQRLQDAVEAVFGHRYDIKGCSRTDSGVHANEFYCTVDVNTSIQDDKIPFALNANLPNDIAVYNCFTVDESFHPRYNVIYKEYIYMIWNARQRNPFEHHRSYHYPRELDTDLMNEAAGHFIGKHDFAGFMSAGSDITDTVREIKYFNVTKENEHVSIKVAADGFLYNMVRILTGTLLYVAENKIKISELDDIISSRDRSKAGITVPPFGLYLNKVVYGDLDEFKRTQTPEK